MRNAIAGAIFLWQVCSGVSIAASITELERQRLIAHLEMTASWLTDEVSGLSPAPARLSSRSGGVDDSGGR